MAASTAQVKKGLRRGQVWEVDGEERREMIASGFEAERTESK